MSVGLPVYNGADYLESTIASILAQTFDSFELIVCDNASTDSTQAICEKLAAQDCRIKYVRHSRNLGAAANYNHAFHASRGEYFKWAAHDDLLAPTYLARCVEALDNDAGCVLAYPGTVIIDETGVQKYCYLDYLASDDPNPAKRFSKWMVPSDGMCNPVFGLVRRDIMQLTCLHGEYMGADRVFLAEIALRGRVKFVDEGLFYRRVHVAMSTRANVGSQSLVYWYTGIRNSGLRFKYWRRLGEFLRMINRVPLAANRRLYCMAIMVFWGLRRGDRLLRELMLPLYMNNQPTALAVWFSNIFGGALFRRWKRS